jgi:phage protein D
MTGLDPGVIVWPTVQVGGSQLPDLAARHLVRTMVDTHLRLPGMFELHFTDMTGAALDAAGVEIGAQVQVTVGSADGNALINGEITAVEGYYQGVAGHTLVRGYDLCHRIQRARRTRSFDNMTDSDIAQQIAKDADLDVGTVSSTQTVHDHLLQHNQTDWEFLAQRASEIGYEFGMDNGKFYFRKASALAQSDGGGDSSDDDSNDGGNGGGNGPQLTMPGSLLRFEPRVTAGNLTPDVEVRTWDPLKAQLSTAQPAKTAADGSSAAGNTNPVGVASQFSKDDNDAAGGASSSTSDDLGAPPSPTAHVVSTIPVADAAAGASALAASVGGHFTEAEGRAIGDPGIKPGATVKISGLPGRFPSDWLITRAKHVFDLSENGYRTEFTAGGANDRSLLGLASAGGSGGTAGGTGPGRIPGVVIGIVDDIGDQHARVRLRLPWLSTSVTTAWAPVVQFGAGKRSGAMFLPEVGDQVLVAFEFGDPRRPYVLGGVVSEKSTYDLGGSAVQQGAGGADTSVVRRGFVSASGSRLVFYDQMGEDPKPQQSQIQLGTADGKFGLSIDVVNGKLEVTCLPDSAGQLTINCGQAGTVNITTGQGGSVTVDGGDSITLKAQRSVTVQSPGTVSVSGHSITLGG